MVRAWDEAKEPKAPAMSTLVDITTYVHSYSVCEREGSMYSTTSINLEAMYQTYFIG